MKYLAFILFAATALADGPGQRRREPGLILGYGFTGMSNIARDFSGFTNTGTATGAGRVTNDGTRVTWNIVSNSWIAASNSVSLSAAATNWTGANILNNGRYNGFGVSFRIDANTAIYAFRESATHFGATGKVRVVSYRLTNDTWDATLRTPFDAVTNDVTGVGGGMWGGVPTLFFGQRHTNGPSGFGFNVGYVTGDATLTNWSAFNLIAFTNTVSTPFIYGPMVTAEGWSFQTWYAFGGGTNQVGIFASTNTTSWFQYRTAITSTVTQYTETCMASLGGSNLVLLSRNEGNGALSATYSSDLGNSWGEPSPTTMGSAAGLNIPYIGTDWRRSTRVVIMDRAAALLVKHETPTGTAAGNIWNNGKSIGGNLVVGYPSAFELNNGDYMVTAANGPLTGTNCALWAVRCMPGDSGLTIAGWIKVLPSHSGGVGYIESLGILSGVVAGHQLLWDDRRSLGFTNSLRFSFADGAARTNINLQNAITTGTWYFVQADYSFSETKARISVNGVVLASIATTTQIGRDRTKSFRIGAGSDNSLPLAALIDNFTIYNVGRLLNPTNLYQRALANR